jgi:hypothetical protein
MRMQSAFVVGVVLFASTAAAQNAPPRVNEPIVHSGLFIMRPDGKPGGFAVQTGEHAGADLAGTLFVSPCSSIGAARPSRPISAFATDVWQMSGRVLELDDQQVSLQVGWRRVRRDGQDESSPEQHTTLILKRGERNTLETINVAATGSCEARSVSLDVIFASRRELYGFDPVRPGAGGGGGSGSAGGRSGFVQGTVKESGAGGGGGMSFGMQKLGHPALEKLSADLWLVRSTPGRSDETLHVTSQVMPIPMTYAFTPLTIQTTAGSVSVKVEGTIEAGLSPQGERQFHFTAKRNITSTTSRQPTRDGSAVVEGSTKTTVLMPGPDEVLSFEMPPLRTADGVTLPDRLSIRVRVNAPQK